MKCLVVILLLACGCSSATIQPPPTPATAAVPVHYLLAGVQDAMSRYTNMVELGLLNAEVRSWVEVRYDHFQKVWSEWDQQGRCEEVCGAASKVRWVVANIEAHVTSNEKGSGDE